MNGRTIVWTRGGQGSVQRIQGEEIHVVSTTAHPPGARIEGLAEGRTVRIKIHGCRKAETGSFELNGRLLDASRELKEWLGQQSPSALS